MSTSPRELFAFLTTYNAQKGRNILREAPGDPPTGANPDDPLEALAPETPPADPNAPPAPDAGGAPASSTEAPMPGAPGPETPAPSTDPAGPVPGPTGDAAPPADPNTPPAPDAGGAPAPPAQNAETILRQLVKLQADRSDEMAKEMEKLAQEATALKSELESTRQGMGALAQAQGEVRQQLNTLLPKPPEELERFQIKTAGGTPIDDYWKNYAARNGGLQAPSGDVEITRPEAAMSHGQPLPKTADAQPVAIDLKSLPVISGDQLLRSMHLAEEELNS